MIAHGTEEQQERFVCPTLGGELTWCQLFSEPGAAPTWPRADPGGARRGRVAADRAEGVDLLAATGRLGDLPGPDQTRGVAKHRGITYFLLDMRSRRHRGPAAAGDDRRAMFNEVFLDDVFVPDECVVGEVDGGWRLARTTLANERVAMAGTRLGDSVERALAVAEESRRPEVGRAVALATAVKLLGTRATLRSLAGQEPGLESSVAKLVGVRGRQDSAELVVDLLGSRVLTDDEVTRAALHELLLTRCLSIAGGTTQVLRNVAGERILGLPRG